MFMFPLTASLFVFMALVAYDGSSDAVTEIMECLGNGLPAAAIKAAIESEVDCGWANSCQHCHSESF